MGGNLTLKCVGTLITYVGVHRRWPLMIGVAQGNYYCIRSSLVKVNTKQHEICFETN